MIEDFVEDFISMCIDDGISLATEICQEAQKRIDEIDVILNESNQLRIEKNNLFKVIQSLSSKPLRNRRNGVSSSNLEPEAISSQLITDICSLIADKGPITPAQILDDLNQLENNMEVYLAIKNLCERGILTRNQNHYLSAGDKWEERPQDVSTIS